MLNAPVDTNATSGMAGAVEENETPSGTTLGLNVEKEQSLTLAEKDIESNEITSHFSSSSNSTEAFSIEEQPSTRQPSLLLRNANLTIREDFRQLDRRLKTLSIEEDMRLFLSFCFGPMNGSIFTKQIFDNLHEFQLSKSSNSQTRSVTPAAIAGVTRRVGCILQEL